MHGKRTPGWWTTRILVGIGIGFVVLVLAVLSGVAQPSFLEPMFDRRTHGLRETLAPIIVVGTAVVGSVVGTIWMIRIARGEDEPPPWRYRDDQRRLPSKRTEEWWVTRFELAVGIGLILSYGILVVSTPGLLMVGGAIQIGPFLIRSGLLVAIIAATSAIVGLIWMIRIARGVGEDEPPPWRYRTH